MDRGFVKIHRRLRDHELWKEKPFAKATAWIDLIMMANHDNCTLEASQRFLARRWGWTISKVRRFLNYLEAEKMISRPTHLPTHLPTQIRLLNYNKYHKPATHLPTHQPTQIEEIEEIFILSSKEDSFLIPEKEEIEEASNKKILQDIKQICDQLKPIWPDVYAFKNKMIRSHNPRALLHALCRTYMKGDFDARGPWGYCTKILKIEHGNYNERDYRKDSPASDKRA